MDLELLSEEDQALVRSEAEIRGISPREFLRMVRQKQAANYVLAMEERHRNHEPETDPRLSFGYTTSRPNESVMVVRKRRRG